MLMFKKFKVVRQLVRLMQPYSWAIPIIVALGALSSFAGGIGISLFIPFIQNIYRTGADTSTGNWLADWLGRLFDSIPPEQRLLFISAVIFGLVFIRVCLSYGNGIFWSWLDAQIGNRLRCKAFEQLLAVNYSFLQSKQSGDLWNTIATETWRTGNALSVFVNMIITTCTLVVYSTLLLLISWKLTLTIAVIMLLISAVVRFLTRRVKVLGEKATQANAGLAQRMYEGFAGMKLIRAFGRESYEQNRFNQASERVSKTFFKLGIIQGTVNPVYEILAAALLVSILFISLKDPNNLPSILVFILILHRLQPKIKSLDGARVSLSSLTASVEKVSRLLDRADKPYTMSGDSYVEGLKKAIVFDRVTFRYDSSVKPALHEVSFAIPAGKTTALVGPSGGGKSTIISLIYRFYEVNEGKIHVDNHLLQELNLDSWRSLLAMVDQNIYLFNATVRENIAYGRLNASRGEIIQAAKEADAHGFISQLPQNYETILGDQGVRLSGGQQQRITLARAIVRNPDILILDEATNALDSISEELIQRALSTLRQNRTVILIAHRLSTIEQADHVIVLEEGRVREQGNLDNLLKLDGLLARLYKLQYRRVLADG
jgi:subfamily B ATP-binding cassette protein MsbA